jgi:class 3 adenylate cyclase
LVELPGDDHYFFVDSSTTDAMLHEIREFTLASHPTQQVERMLTTVLFTDMVDSTKKAAELGDARWHGVLEQHNSMVRNEVHRYNGQIVKNTGDGFLATFDGPTRAIKCAWEVTRSSTGLGIEVRVGIHTGECIVGPTDVSGIAIHLASRVVGEASPGEVLVTSTVRDLVYGSGVSFTDRGEHQLKGIDEKKHLYSVTNTG